MGSVAHRVLLLGSHGGVGRAFCALLEKSAPGRRLLEQLGGLFLADSDPRGAPPTVHGSVALPPTTVASAEDLASLIRQHDITQVVDLSSLDTVDCTRVCDDLGCHYLSTSVEEWPARGSIPTDEAIAQLLPPYRPSVRKKGHLIGSGANPGIVNALVFAALEEFAERVGVAPTVDALALHSILITEEDTTSNGEISGDVFGMSWHPEHCLEEMFEPRAFVARDGRIVDLGHRPTDRLYQARCGDDVIEGMVIPHEETVTLATRLPNVEIAFVYRIAPAALAAIKAHPQRDTPSAWRTRRLYPPHTSDLTGYDRLGVLLCSRRYGELWKGFHTDMATGFAYGTNATQLQVAAGVVAGLAQLGTRRGIHFVEDLDWRDFVDTAAEILGPPIIVHDPSATARTISTRAREANGG